MEAKVKEPKYKNWIKCTLGFGEVKDALKSQAEASFLDVHYDLLQKCDIDHIRNNHNSCNVTFDRKKKGNPPTIKTNCSTYQLIFDKVLAVLDDPASDHVYWSNTSFDQMLSSSWALAKVFMPRGNTKCNEPDETDAAAILNVFNTCKLFHPIDVSVIDKLIKGRNAVMHSPNNMVTREYMEDIFASMLELLEFDNWGKGGNTSLKNRCKCQTAAETIRQLKDADFEISLKLEYKALETKQLSLNHDIAEKVSRDEDVSALKKARRQIKDDIKFRFEKDGTSLKAKNTEELRKERDILLRENEILDHSAENLTEVAKKEQQKLTLMKDNLKALPEVKQYLKEDSNRKLLREIGLLSRQKKERTSIKSDIESQFDDLLRTKQKLKDEAERHGIPIPEEIAPTQQHLKDDRDVINMLDNILDDKTLGRMAHLLGKQPGTCEPLMLARVLNLPPKIVEKIDSSSPGEDNIFSILEVWVQYTTRKGNTTTVRKLVEILEEYYTWHILIEEIMKTAFQHHYDVPDVMLDAMPSDEMCVVASQFMDNNIYEYVFLFLELGMKYEEIEQVVKQKLMKSETIRLLLVAWGNKFKDHATIRVLLDTIKMLNKDIDITELVSKLKDTHTVQSGWGMKK